MQCKVLVIDDDNELLQITRRYLENHGLEVVYLSNPLKAVELTKKVKPDLIITDAEMPEMDGFAVCKEIKGMSAFSKVPVIIISGKKKREKDILGGYNKGADDYLIKPFSFPILLAKIKNLLARYKTPDETSQTIKEWNMIIDRNERVLKIKGNKINLTRKEFNLLSLLISKKGRILSVPYLLEAIWGYDPAVYSDPHTVKVHISSLRKKLGEKVGKHIKSVTGHGYKII